MNIKNQAFILLQAFFKQRSHQKNITQHFQYVNTICNRLPKKTVKLSDIKQFTNQLYLLNKFIKDLFIGF